MSVAASTDPPGSGAKARPTGCRGWARCFVSLGGIAIGLGAILMGFGRGGLWDPYELRMAEVSRRLAVAWLGAKDAILPDAGLGGTHLSDLSSGELPYTSTAIGFWLFGAHDWSGRIVSLFWALLAVASLALLVGRLAGLRAQVLAIVVLATTPLFAWQARAMLGDAATMAASAMALSGFTLACFEPPSPGTRGRLIRLAFVALGLVGAGLGLLCRGPILGVAVPALGVGIVASLHRFYRVAPVPPRPITWTLVALSAVAVLVGTWALMYPPRSARAASLLVGVVGTSVLQVPTFESIIVQVAHGAFPWSALLPLAAVVVMRSSPVGDEAGKQWSLGHCLIAVTVVGFAAQGMVARTIGVTPYCEVAALAGTIGLALVRLHRELRVSTTAALVAVAILVLLWLDFRELPDTGMVATGIEDAHLPAGFEAIGMRWVRSAALLSAGGLLVAGLFPYPSHARPFDGAEYRRIARVMRTAKNGQVAFGFVLLETMLASFALLQFAANHGWPMPALQQLGPTSRDLLSVAWLVMPGLVLVVPIFLLVLRDVGRVVFSEGIGTEELKRLGRPVDRAIRWLHRHFPLLKRARLSPIDLAIVAVIASGLLMVIGYVPSLAEHLSPKCALARFRELSRSGEPLGLLRVRPEGVRYYVGAGASAFDDLDRAIQWLRATSGQRWLLLNRRDLASANAVYRTYGASGRNLPIVDANCGDLLLAAQRLPPHSPDQNPLSDLILDRPPKPEWKLDASFGWAIEALGWEFVDDRGIRSDVLRPSVPYELRLYFKVIDPTPLDWEIFVHIDGHGRRHNADHPPLRGLYPTSLWQAGDIMADRFTVTLDPGFPRGRYSLYFGFFRGNRRLEVDRGPQIDDRVLAGSITVQ